MRKLIILALITIYPVLVHSQSLKGYYYNEQYQVYLYLNADSSSIKVPGQDIYGDLVRNATPACGLLSNVSV